MLIAAQIIIRGYVETCNDYTKIHALMTSTLKYTENKTGILFKVHVGRICTVR